METKNIFKEIISNYNSLLSKKNRSIESNNNIYNRYHNPILTKNHIPPSWRFDFNLETNPYGLERIGYNSVFNAGAIMFDGKFTLVARVEGNDRKSFFAIAQSTNGIDNFEFWDTPIIIPQNELIDTNVYDMRLIKHEDGWIYGLFCTERKDPNAPESDTSSAIAQAGIIRTKDLKNWERLEDLKTNSDQQRNVVLHPEFIDGKYAFYTRPQDGFIKTGSGGGIGFGFSESIENSRIDFENILDPKIYHTIYELKNGMGPAPIKTEEGWINLAHGVRNTAAGLRYVLYLFMTELDRPWVLKYKPSGHFMAPEGNERIGDVSNVLFSNGWIVDEHNTIFIYYASSDTRMHVATTTVDKLIDYCKNTKQDNLYSHLSVENIVELINNNKNFSI